VKRTVTLLLLSCSFAVTACTPFHQEWTPPVKKCEIWVKVDNGPWHCYERGEVNEMLRRL